jgi:hypothetical protein
MPSKCKRCVEGALACNDLPATWSAGEELMLAVECAELPLVEQLLRVHGAAIANHRRQLRIRVSFALFCYKTMLLVSHKRQRAPSSLKNASAIYVDRFSETDNGHHYRIVRSIKIEQQALKG